MDGPYHLDPCACAQVRQNSGEMSACGGVGGVVRRLTVACLSSRMPLRRARETDIEVIEISWRSQHPVASLSAQSAQDRTSRLACHTIGQRIAFAAETTACAEEMALVRARAHFFESMTRPARTHDCTTMTSRRRVDGVAGI